LGPYRFTTISIGTLQECDVERLSCVNETAIPKILNAPTVWQEQELKFEESPHSCSITFVRLAKELDNYEFDSETGEEHYWDEEDPDFDIIAKRSWPGHFPVSIFNLYSLWEELSYNGV
jgi:hypothetical protein